MSMEFMLEPPCRKRQQWLRQHGSGQHEWAPLKPLTATTGDRIGERLLQPLDPLASSMPAKAGIAGVIPGKGQPSSSQVLTVTFSSLPPQSTATKPELKKVTIAGWGKDWTILFCGVSEILADLCARLGGKSWNCMVHSLCTGSF